MSDLQFDLNDLLDISVEAGELILGFYRNDNFNTSIKHDSTLVTTADIKANSFLKKSLLHLCPTYGFLSEENNPDYNFFSEPTDCEFYWVVDPLDGTLDFINKTDDFSVSIALMSHNRIILGLVYIPCAEICYYAVTGLGAFKQYKNLSKQKLLVKNNFNSTNISLLAGRRSGFDLYKNYLSDAYNYEIITRGSCSIKCCLVADQVADIYMSLGSTSVWDLAAAHCILLESKAHVYDFELSEVAYDVSHRIINPKFIATNLPLDKLRNLLR